MELSPLRAPLREVRVLAQLQCSVLDEARLNVLQVWDHHYLTLTLTPTRLLDETRLPPKRVRQRIQAAPASEVLSLDELQPGTTYHVQCLGEEGAHDHGEEWSRYTPSRPYVEGDPEFEALRGCRVVHCLPQSIVVVGSGQGHTQCTTRAVHLPSVHG